MMNQYRVKLTCRKPNEYYTPFVIDVDLAGPTGRRGRCLHQEAEEQAIREAKNLGYEDISVVNVTYC